MRLDCLDKSGLVELAEDCEEVGIDEIRVTPEELFRLINSRSFIFSLDEKNREGFLHEVEYLGHIFTAKAETPEYSCLLN